MNITAASLSQLEAGRSYYLSNSTGTIKKTTLWQWFKCVTGLGDGRAKAQRLADLVKTSLLANAELKEDAALSGELAGLGKKYSLSGASLRDIANRFKTAHADAIAAVDARNQAFRHAEEAAKAGIDDWVQRERVLSTPENLAYVRKIALYSVQHLANKAYEDRGIQDPEALKSRMSVIMRTAIESINTVEIMQAAQRSGPGYPATKNNGEKRRSLPVARLQLDELHFRAILAAMMTREGPAPSSDFVWRLRSFKEEILQRRRDDLLAIRLEPPDTPMAGFVFAEKATKLCQALQDAEKNPQNPQNIQ